MTTRYLVIRPLSGTHVLDGTVLSRHRSAAGAEEALRRRQRACRAVHGPATWLDLAVVAADERGRWRRLTDEEQLAAAAAD